MSYEIMFCDIDGTILGHGGVCSDKTKESVLKLMNTGKKIVLTSGRNAYSIINVLTDTLGIETGDTCSICLNGAHIIHNETQETLYLTTISLDVVEEVFRVCHEEGASTHCYTANHVYFPKEDSAMKEFQQILGNKIKVIKRLEEMEEPPVKVIVTGKYLTETEEEAEMEHNKLQRLKEILIPRIGDKVNVEFSVKHCLEFSSKEATKGTGLKFICDYYGIDVKNSIAIGDGENDISMLKEAGMSAAPANALDNVKTKVDYVTKLKAEEGAVSEVIETFIL